MAGGSQCRGDHVRTALLLLEAGAEVDAPGGEGAFTPMYAAVCRADLEKVRLLIAWGADVDHKITTGDRDTFLHQVARRQELPVADAVSMIKLLIDAGADVNALGLCRQDAPGCRGTCRLRQGTAGIWWSPSLTGTRGNLPSAVLP